LNDHRERLEPDVAKSGALCMEQYRFMFNSTRIPKIPADITRNSDPKENNYIVVMRKNKFFKLDVSCPDGKQLNYSDLYAYFLI
jgi:carnitine O-acetyltransferase